MNPYVAIGTALIVLAATITAWCLCTWIADGGLS